MTIDQAKVRRENMRWTILLTLNNARPIGAYEELILMTVQAVWPDATPLEVRRELDYLGERNLIHLAKESCGRWSADLTHYGVDIAEYTIDCNPGIARPAKYWS
jgi:hypothetical protein